MLLLLCAMSWAEEWPTFRHDVGRSGATGERLDARRLREAWTWRSPHAPQPAWAGPAKWDAYHNLRGLRSMRNYDPVFHVVAAGDAVYFGSSVDDAVRCLDAATGRGRWVAHADGPIRIAPTVADGRLYFGSDDGAAYCIRADDGGRLWSYSPARGTRRVLCNGRLISRWPVRTGVVVDGGTAWFGASLLPWQPSYLCAVDAATGKPSGAGRYVAKLDGLTLEGALLASGSSLIVPQGRVSPLVFDRGSGKPLGGFKGGGGCMVVLTADQQVLHGPGNKGGWITASHAGSRAQVANYPGGNAVVVAGRTAYLLTDRHLLALDRSTGRARWRVASRCPHELVLAGDVLFAGGDGRVAAFAAADGKRLWTHAVRGRAHGLAVARGSLYVSTDEGAIHCFRPTGQGEPRLPAEPRPAPPAEALAAIEPIDDAALLGRWVFHRSQIAKGKAKALAGKHDAAVLGKPTVERVGRAEALKLNGKSDSVLVAADHKRAPLPTREMTAEAWVRVDKPLEWGGIVGAIQDNGAYERGWLLGYRHDRFTFALAATGGANNLGYLDAKTPFRPGDWHHVVGTYEGKTKRLYVNGKLANAAADQSGDILYPPKTWYEIGAYHDNNEHYRMTGALHEVCIYKRALSDGEVAARYRAGRSRFVGPLRLAVGPIVEFVDPRAAIVRWRTEPPASSYLEFRSDGAIRHVLAPPFGIEHTARLDRLRRNQRYAYRVAAEVNGVLRRTRWFELDTFFNYSVPPALRPPGLPPAGAKEWPPRSHVLPHTPIRRGIAVVLGCDRLDVVQNLVHDSLLRVIAVDSNEGKLAKVRQWLGAERGSAYRAASLDALPFPDSFADVVVLWGKAGMQEAERILRPGGTGCVLDGRRVVGTFARKPPPGSGAWTHVYGRADNSAYGGEALGGATRADDLAVQWLGRPGPRFQADRNGRKPSPLAVEGRLFLQGLERIAALNAYNGTILWSREMPGFRRFNVPRDCSNWCADTQHVYAAVRDKLYRLDAATGSLSKTYGVVPGEQDWAWDWGFVARDGTRIVGSAVKQGTAYTDFWGGGGWYDHKVAPKVCSDGLFALDAATGKRLWARAEGVAVNSTITIADGRVYAVECRNPEVKASDERRVGMPELWQSQFLTALDARTGAKVWERYVDVVDALTVLYLAASDGKLVLVASGSETYEVCAFDATDGKALWRTRFKWPKGDHGAHMSRPALVGGKVFVRPRVFDLATGSHLAPAMPGGGCGTYAATDRMLVFRAGAVTLWDRERGTATKFARLRPDCWLSTIPACGMLLSPEGGGGCSCGAWLETSVGFLPITRK